MPLVSKVSLSQFYTYCVAKNIPFAFYRLPEEKDVKVVSQTEPGTHKIVFGATSLKAGGFIFAPFVEDEHYKKVLIQPGIVCTETTLPALNFGKTNSGQPITSGTVKFKVKQTGKQQYKTLVRKIKKEIGKKNYVKIIAARVIKKAKPPKFDPAVLFSNLCKQYPQAFVSMVYTADYGLWIGASPEILLNLSNRTFKTYALAGTKANTAQNLKKDWGSKEMEEHTIVSSYISGALSKITGKQPQITGPETIAAGNLLHLRTTFNYKNASAGLWQKAVTALHPTPAIAGLPKRNAIKFIQRHEQSPRAFYSGYLGPVNINGEINLYVNLRCMHVLKNKLAIYVGCGITGNSDPEAEWVESKIKSQTLINVLKT